MGQRNMLCTSQMMDLETDQGFLHSEPCILLGPISQPDVQAMVTATGNTTNLDACHVPECFDGAVYYGMPRCHGIQHPHHYPPNLNIGAVSTSNFYVPHINGSSGMPLGHGSHDQFPSSGNYGVVGLSADENGTNGYLMDHTRGLYKRKTAEGHQGNCHYFNASASSSSSSAPLSTRHPEEVSLMDGASMTLPQYRGSGSTSIREIDSHRISRNRLGASRQDPVRTYNQNHFTQGSYMGQLFQPAGSLWLDQQFGNNSSNAGASAWPQTAATTHLHRNNVGGTSMEMGNMGPQQFHEPISNISNTSFLHPPSVNLRHQNYHNMLPPIQGMRGHNVNFLPQAPAAPFRVPTSHDALDVGLRHVGAVQPTGLRIYRSHHEGVVPETTLRHRNFPQLRVLPTDGVAVLDFPDYYEVENYVDHHRDMRLDIEDMSYEELLALGEQIGNVNTGVSEETIRSQLKMRTYLPSQMLINLEQVACIDQEPDSCVICQDDYKNQEKIGTLDCGHEYHADCLKQWLRLKNVCPICKCEALAERKDA